MELFLRIIDVITNIMTMCFTGIAAIAAIIALTMVIIEIGRKKREEISHLFNGYEFAKKIIESDDFTTFARKVLEESNPDIQHDEWFISYPKYLSKFYKYGEVLDYLINKGYLDKDLFFRLEGFRLGDLGRRLLNFEGSRNSPSLFYWGELYKNGKQFFIEINNWSETERKKWTSLDPGENPQIEW